IHHWGITFPLVLSGCELRYELNEEKLHIHPISF
ncbi:hypothetical protein D039_3207B, partial [Vibrio parahaemolyticus EKP-028]